MNRFRPYIIPSTLFVFSFIVRLLLISKGPHHPDCLWLAVKAQETLSTLKFPYLQNPGHPLTGILGVLSVLGAKLLNISDPVIAVNFMSVLFGSLCIPANYFFVKKLFNQTAAIFSSILLSYYPVFLAISTFGNSHTPSLFFLLLGLYLLLKYFENSSLKTLLLCGLCIGLMGASRIQDMILVTFPISFLFFQRPHKFENKPTPSQSTSLKCYFIFISATIITVAFFYVPLLVDLLLNNSINQFLGTLGSNFVAPPKGIIFPFLSWSISHLYFALTPAGFVSAIFGLFHLSKKNSNICKFFMCWVIPSVFFFARLVITRPRFLIITAIPLIIVEGYLFSKFVKFNLLTKISTLLIFLIIISVSFLNIYPVVLFRHNYSLISDYAKRISKITEPNAQIITADESHFIRYYGNRATIGRPLSCSLRPYTQKEFQNFKANIDHILEQGIPLYATSPGLYTYETNSQFSSFVKKNYDVEAIEDEKILTEDWHYGCDTLDCWWDPFYRIKKK